MRCTCQSVDEFLERLLAEGPANAVTRSLSFARYRRPLGKGPTSEETRWAVSLLVTTVIEIPGSGGQFLLEAGEDCGIDYTDSTNELAGTRRLEELRAKIDEFALKWGLRVLPGAIQI